MAFFSQVHGVYVPSFEDAMKLEYCPWCQTLADDLGEKKGMEAWKDAHDKEHKPPPVVCGHERHQNVLNRMNTMMERENALMKSRKPEDKPKRRLQPKSPFTGSGLEEDLEDGF